MWNNEKFIWFKFLNHNFFPPPPPLTLVLERIVACFKNPGPILPAFVSVVVYSGELIRLLVVCIVQMSIITKL